MVENGGHFEKRPQRIKMRLQIWQQVESDTLQCYQTRKSKKIKLGKIIEVGIVLLHMLPDYNDLFTADQSEI